MQLCSADLHLHCDEIARLCSVFALRYQTTHSEYGQSATTTMIRVPSARRIEVLDMASLLKMPMTRAESCRSCLLKTACAGSAPPQRYKGLHLYSTDPA